MTANFLADDTRNGTITISNIGSVGGGWFTPVINHPEAAILRVGYNRATNSNRQC